MREQAVFSPIVRRRPRRGGTLLELVATFLILAFVTSGTVGLYYVGTRQQRGSRFYTLAQTDLREGIRRITRTVRHGSGVLTTASPASAVSPSSGFPVKVSDASQIIVDVHLASSTANQIRIYRNSTTGTIYAQTAGDAPTLPGTVMVDGPATLAIAYYQTGATSTGTSTTDVTASAPAAATEVQLTISATRGNVTTTSVAYVQLRNANFGF